MPPSKPPSPRRTRLDQTSNSSPNWPLRTVAQLFHSRAGGVGSKILARTFEPNCILIQQDSISVPLIANETNFNTVSQGHAKRGSLKRLSKFKTSKCFACHAKRVAKSFQRLKEKSASRKLSSTPKTYAKHNARNMLPIKL